MGVVANLVVRVTAATSDFDKQIRSLERSFDRTGSKLQSIGSRLTAGVTVPLAGAAIAATKFAADFEKSTTKLVTLSGVSESQMKQLRQSVLDLAPTVGIGPRALSEALLVVTSTGFQGAEALQILELAAKSSAVGMGDTKDVARALTAVVSAYGVENLSAAQAADVLHATVVAGGAEASELAGELGRVVGVAAQLGVQFQEVGAFIATYTRLGLSAAEATTALSGVLNTVLSPSAEARKALEGVGLSADGLRQMVSEQGLGAALTTLLGRLNGNADAIGAVFGNVRALAGVMGTAGVQASAYADTLNQIKTSAGNLNKAFEETKKTFAFQWDQFRAQAERAAITLGIQLLPAMTRIMHAAQPLLQMVVAMIDGFSRLPAPVQTAALAAAGFVAALGPVLVVIGNLMQAFSGVLATMRLIGGAMPVLQGGFVALGSVLATPIGIVASLAGMFAVLTVKIRESIRELGFFQTMRQQLPGQTAGGAGAMLGIGAGVKLAEWAFGSGSAGRPGAGAKGGDTNLAAETPAAITRALEQETARLDATLGRVLGKYSAIGQTGPAAMARTLDATMRVSAVSGLGGLALPGGEDMDALRKAGMPMWPLPVPVGHTTGLDNIAGMLPGAMALPGMPKLPGFFGQVFGGSQNFAGGLSGTILQALTGGGNVGGAIGGQIGGQLAGGLAKSLIGKMAGSGIGKALGGIAGSVLGPLGSMVGGWLGGKVAGWIGGLFGGGKGRNLVKDFADQMGGFDSLHSKLSALGETGEQLWVKLTQGVGKNNPEQAKAVIEEVAQALEEGPKKKMAAIQTIAEAVNLRAENISSQADFDVVGAGAVGAFALQIQNGASAIEAFRNITGAVTAMRDAQAANNFTMTESSARLFEIGAILDTHAVQFQNVAASGTIVQAMLQGNIRDAGLFSAVAMDLGLNIQRVIDSGVPMAQVFAMAQPQLQALWEAQQKFGFETDAATAALLKEAETQGFVGAQMKGVNEQILSVLVAIGDVLGAKIPAAMRGLPAAAQAAADGMNDAFSSVRGPRINDEIPEGIGDGGGHYVDVPQLAKGGIVRARMGGTLVNVGEGGRDEAVVPLASSGLSGGGGGGSMTVIIEQDGRQAAEFIVPYIPDAVRRYGLA